jgi:V8-like Glu-specific endopeptidase
VAERSLSAHDRIALRVELARLYRDEPRLRSVLADIGYPEAALPPGLSVRDHWSRVIDDLNDGAEPGLPALLEYVLSPWAYPHNEVLRRIALDYAPELVARQQESGSVVPLAARTGLGGYPVDWSRADLQEALKILQTVYQPSEIRTFAQMAGIDTTHIRFAGLATVIWSGVFEEAARAGRVDLLLDAVGGFYPSLGLALNEVRGTSPGSSGPASEPPAELLVQEDPWDDLPGMEAVIDESAPTFVDIVFFAQGLDRARSVCRLVPWFAEHRIGSGTGFRIGPDLILTSHHILFDWARGSSRALAVDAWFNYEVDEQGMPRKKVEIACDPASVVGEHEHDWAVIRTKEPIPDAFPALPLGEIRPPEIGDRVSIIQHPQRLPKKVAFQHNLIRDVKPDRILYWTDTEEGSSGSPVFDRDWQVVALHHWTIPAPAGERSKWWNQGRRIDQLVKRMEAKGIEIPRSPR